MTTQSDFAVGLIITDTAFIDGTTDGNFEKQTVLLLMELVIRKKQC